MLLISIVLIVFPSYVISNELNLQNLPLKDGCKISSEVQRKLFTSYFRNVHLIKVVKIFNQTLPKKVSEYYRDLNLLLQEHFTMPILLQEFRLDFEELTTFEYFEMFSWQGEKFPLRAGQNPHMHIFGNERGIYFLQTEDVFGVIVILENLKVLDEYFYGIARQPFKNPKMYFVFVLLEGFDDKVLHKILERIWKSYAVLNVLVLTCNSDNITYYNPFEYLGDDEWGVVKNQEVDDINIFKTRHYPPTFNGYPFLGVFFYRPPAALKWDDLPIGIQNSYHGKEKEFYSKYFCGYDATIFYNLAEKLNFNPMLKQLCGRYRFGETLRNGTIVGTTGELYHGRATLAVNLHFIMDYGTSDIDYLYQMFFDEFCVIAPKAFRIPQSLAVFNCFKLSTWLFIVIMNFIFGFLWQFFKSWSSPENASNIKYKLRNKNSGIWYFTLIDMWIIMTSGSISQKMFKNSEQLFLMGTFLLNIITNGIFQGFLATSYSTIVYYKDIKTMKDLDESGLKVALSTASMKYVFGDKHDSDEVFASLTSKIVVDEGFSKNRTAIQRDICFLERKLDYLMIKKDFELPDGTKLLHGVEDCPRFYYSSMLIRRGWPLADRFNHILLIFDAAGLNTIWFEQLNYAFDLKRRTFRLLNGYVTNQRRPFSLNDMKIAFRIIMVGHLISTGFFVAEILCKKIPVF